jgi:hypothetical protein
MRSTRETEIITLTSRETEASKPKNFLNGSPLVLNAVSVSENAVLKEQCRSNCAVFLKVHWQYALHLADVSALLQEKVI